MSRCASVQRLTARRRLRPLLLLVLLASTGAAAQEQTPACTAELAALDSSFVQAMQQLLAAGGSRAEQCTAVARQLSAIAMAVDVHVRCFPPGEQLDSVVKMLTDSAQGFRQAQADLGCNVAVTSVQTLGSTTT